jgi:hypothetical protein
VATLPRAAGSAAARRAALHRKKVCKVISGDQQP